MDSGRIGQNNKFEVRDAISWTSVISVYDPMEEAFPTYQTMLDTLDGVRDDTGGNRTSWGNLDWTFLLKM